jgi:hypothetical protein
MNDNVCALLSRCRGMEIERLTNRLLDVLGVGVDAPNTPNSDYETWVPADGTLCILGERTEYVRRKRDRECYNGLSYESKRFVATCACTPEDFIWYVDCSENVDWF